jgi:monoamine oxidase
MEDADVIVIGAGFAGLAAAERLAAANRRVIVLEASDRVGGRAHTDYRLADGKPLELGAQMVHGRKAVTHSWISREGFHTRRLPITQRSRIIVGRRVASYPWMALPFHPVAGTRAVYDGFVRMPRQIDAAGPPDRSVEQFLAQRRVHPVARLIVSNLYAHVYAADPDAIGVLGPAEEYRVAPEPYGFRNFQLVEGYSALVDRVTARLGNRIRRNCAVTEVRVVPTGVRVRATGPAGPSTEYSAAGVIVTVPLGVLKSGSIVFDPPLPKEKREAIEQIAFGDVYALQLRVRNGTMRRRLGDFGLLWGGTPTAYYRPRVALGESGTEFVTAFTVGREARRRSALPDDELISATVAEWDKVVPAGVTLGAVEGSVVARWPTDPWVRGGYSYLPPGVGIAARRALAAPVGDRLFFAGEATDAAGQSATVHGAIDTGTRAAEECLAMLRQDGG